MLCAASAAGAAGIASGSRAAAAPAARIRQLTEEVPHGNAFVSPSTGPARSVLRAGRRHRAGRRVGARRTSWPLWTSHRALAARRQAHLPPGGRVVEQSLGGRRACEQRPERRTDRGAAGGLQQAEDRARRRSATPTRLRGRPSIRRSPQRPRRCWPSARVATTIITASSPPAPAARAGRRARPGPRATGRRARPARPAAVAKRATPIAWPSKRPKRRSGATVEGASGKFEGALETFEKEVEEALGSGQGNGRHHRHHHHHGPFGPTRPDRSDGGHRIQRPDRSDGRYRRRNRPDRATGATGAFQPGFGRGHRG